MSIATMYQWHISPSMGAIRRPLSHEVAAAWSNCSIRFFHLTTRRCKDDSTNSSSTNSAQSQRETRRTRQNAAIRQVTGLQQRRPLPAHAGLAAGAFPSGQHRSNQQGDKSTDGSTTTSPSRPLIRRVSGESGPSQPRTPPPGTMVRAPANLRITRNAGGPGIRGPNLRGGRSAGPRENRSVGRGSEAAPKRRERKAATASAGANKPGQDVTVEDTLSNGMIQQLLRLQRKEWDKKSYEPKYAHGSQAAMELIETGKKLFEGEVPTVKKPGRLEYRIGIAGMHGA